jgi:manganese/zinc/iron transport system permease protein
VLPGLVVAFILSGSVSIVWMFVGALAVGLLTTFLSQDLARTGGVTADASMGIVFTSLFAVGVLLIKRYSRMVDLDADCVFQGQLQLLSLYRIELWGASVPRALVTTVPALLVNLAFILICWKELKITSFDPELATTMGLRSGLLHYLLMVLVATTAVGSFEAVGSVLVVAMFIVPGAVAHLLTDRLGWMLALSAAIAVAVAGAGYYLAVQWDAEPAGMMAVVAGTLFVVAVFFSPRYGLASKVLQNLQIARRILREDLLAMLFRVEELGAPRRLTARDAVAAVGGGVQAAWEMWRLVKRGLVVRSPAGLQLSEAGRARAQQLVRSHRLWEAYLVEFLGLPLDHVHAPAERMEHYIDQRLAEKIVENLAAPDVDPHGREIPRS